MSHCILEQKNKGNYTQFRIKIQAFGRESVGPYTSVPPVIWFNQTKHVLTTFSDMVKDVPKNPYFAGGKDFTPERLRNLEITNLFKHFEDQPAVEREIVNEEWVDHPISEFLNESIVRIKPSPKLEKELSDLNYVEAGKRFSEYLINQLPAIEETLEMKLDPYSIPKRDVGNTMYYANSQGVSFAAKLFNFGYHDTFPVDRATRELSSLKQAERFLTPYQPKKITTFLQPYVTFLRVAIVKTLEPMLDGGDLFLSGEEKICCDLSKISHDLNFSNINEPGVVLKPNRGGIDVWRKVVEHHDERIKGVGPCRLVFPGGVKVCANPVKVHAKSEKDNEPIDLLLDFRTIVDKGALGLFSMLGPESFGALVSYDTAKATFLERKPEYINIGGKIVEGYVCLIPTFRPRQRDTEICGISDNKLDLISYAILNKEIKVQPHIENEYQSLKEFRSCLENEIQKHI